MLSLSKGDRVRINLPGDPPVGNPRLHGSLAVVDEVTDWGAHLIAPEAATGRYRAWHDEMVPVDHGFEQTQNHEPTKTSVVDVAPNYYEGTPCPQCGMLTLRRCGMCLRCDSCFTTSGCD